MSKSDVTARKADFSVQDGDRHFKVIWDGFRVSFGKFAKGYDELRTANKIGKKLRSISVEAPAERDVTARALKDGDPSVKVIYLTDPEWTKLKAMVENPDIEWVFVSGERIEAAIEFLRALPEAEMEEK